MRHNVVDYVLGKVNQPPVQPNARLKTATAPTRACRRQGQRRRGDVEPCGKVLQALGKQQARLFAQGFFKLWRGILRRAQAKREHWIRQFVPYGAVIGRRQSPGVRGVAGFAIHQVSGLPSRHGDESATRLHSATLEGVRPRAGRAGRSSDQWCVVWRGVAHKERFGHRAQFFAAFHFAPAVFRWTGIDQPATAQAVSG